MKKKSLSVTCLSVVIALFWTANLWADTGRQSALNNIVLKELTSRKPVSLGAAISRTEAVPGETLSVLVKGKVMSNWHIYARDYTGQFKVVKHTLDLPEGIEAQGDWDRPSAEVYHGSMETLLYRGDLEFSQKIKVTENQSPGEYVITVVFDYQACDPTICLPPKKERFPLVLTVK